MTKTLEIALKAVDDKKGVDVIALDIAGIASFASYFLLCTGESPRQIQALADEVELRLKQQGVRAAHIEGYRNAEWVLMDYLDLVVHIFSRKARSYYDLERLWRDGKRLDIDELLSGTPSAAPVESGAAHRPARRK